MARIAFVLIVSMVAGCAGLMRPEGPDPAAVQRAIALAAVRVQSCYRQPRVPFRARQIVTRLRVRYAADGQLLGLPTVVSQTSVTAESRPYAGSMAEAAVAAVLRCGAMRLPPAIHSGGWDEFNLTFSPNAVA